MKRVLWALAFLLASVAPAFATNCGSYTYTLTNGQTADANQVMANFNTILNCGNNNLAHNGANSDITSLTGLTTPLSVPQGGTGLGTLTANGITIGNGASTPTFLTTSTTGALPFWTGSAWGAATLTAGNNITITNASGGVTIAATTSAGGFVNKLRDPTMVSWPNGTSGTCYTAPSGAVQLIAANGWTCQASGAAGSWAQQATGHNGTYYSLKVVGASSNTDLWIAQRIGGSDGAALAGNNSTFQVAFFNDTSGSVTPKLSTCYASSFENFGTCTSDLAATNLQACAATTWCIESYTLAVSSSASNGYEVMIDLGAQASTSDIFYFTAADLRSTPGVSTGLNSSPPTPELPGTAIEMQRDAAYYQTTYPNGTAPGTSETTNVGGAFSQAATAGSTAVGPGSSRFRVEMRAAPTLTSYDLAGNAGKNSVIGTGSTSATNNIAFTTAPSQITSQGFLWQGGNSASTGQTAFVEIAAYADFW